MKIINTTTKETVFEIYTNMSFTLDEAISFAGGWINNEQYLTIGEPDVIINGKRYYYEELELRS